MIRVEINGFPIGPRELVFAAGAALVITGAAGIGWQYAAAVVGLALIHAARHGSLTEWDHSLTPSDSAPPEPPHQ